MILAATLSCLFLGDSIDLGAAAAVRARYGLACDVMAHTGVSASAAVRWTLPERAYDVVIMSLGSNNPQDPRLSQQLYRIRAGVRTRRVIWILPYDREAAGIVTNVAVHFRDDRLDLASIATRDGVHPANYEILANALVD